MEYKICTKCKESRLLDLFSQTGKGRLQASCKICQRLKNKAYREEDRLNPGLRRSKIVNQRRVQNYKSEKLIFLEDYKRKPCLDCGLTFPSVCMDFDHRPGCIKKFGIARGVCSGVTMKQFLEELEKCDLVCSNCHRIRTFITRKDEHTEKCLSDRYVVEDTGEEYPRIRKTKSHCLHGHTYDEKNTYIYKGAKHCRECDRLKAAHRYSIHKEEINKRRRKH